MEFSTVDFVQDCNPQVEQAIGRNAYILLSDLSPLISLAKQKVSVSLGYHSLEKPEVRSVSFERSFFSNIFSCPPPAEKSGCTCCSPIRGVSLYGTSLRSDSHSFLINGVAREFSMFKGSCPLFNGSCTLGGSAEKFYTGVPLPCAISPGWSVKQQGGSVLVGRKLCRHGKKAKYSESKLHEDSIILSRIAGFLRSLSLEPAFEPADLGRCLKAQLL